MHLSRLLVVAAASAALLVPALPASAAHFGNNKAELAGAASGTATVNYVKGQEEGTDWNARVRTQGLAPGDYTYTVNGPAGVQEVCDFVVADSKGSDGCSRSGFALGGFTTAEIRDAAGAVVASGVFDRRGNCREADQGGSQCEAPGKVG